MENEQQDRLVIDNSGLTTVAHLLENRESVLLQHGGVCTRIDFDKVEAMDLHTFLVTEVPRLHEQDRGLLVLRNAAAGAYTFILGDQVLRYNAVNVTEVGLQEMSRYIATEETSVWTPDIPYPIIVRKSDRNGVKLTVKVPTMKRKYTLHDTRRYTDFKFETDYYPPPVWFSVQLTSAGAVMASSVAVAPEPELHWENTRLCAWPLSNVFSSCQICVGDTEMAVAFDRKLLEAESLQLSLDRFFNSAFNFDIPLTPRDYESILGDAFDTAAGSEKYAEALEACSRDVSHQGLLKVLCVLEEPNGWQKLRFSAVPIKGTTKTFCGV